MQECKSQDHDVETIVGNVVSVASDAQDPGSSYSGTFPSGSFRGGYRKQADKCTVLHKYCTVCTSTIGASIEGPHRSKAVRVIRPRKD